LTCEATALTLLYGGNLTLIFAVEFELLVKTIDTLLVLALLIKQLKSIFTLKVLSRYSAHPQEKSCKHLRFKKKKPGSITASWLSIT
jgi:hypothetical protein